MKKQIKKVRSIRVTDLSIGKIIEVYGSLQKFIDYKIKNDKKLGRKLCKDNEPSLCTVKK